MVKKLLSLLTIIKDSKVSKSAKIYPFSVLKNSELGDFTYVSYGCVVNNCNIGKYCSIAKDVKIGLGLHPTKFVSSSPVFYSPSNPLGVAMVKKSTFVDTDKVKIGNDVWIGTNAVILDGVVIGDGAVIGANAVVNKDVSPYTIVGGVPAKVIRKRFPDPIVDLLIDLKWWDLPIDVLRQHEILNIFSKEVNLEDLILLRELIDNNRIK